ncbi:MAG: Endoribonuclease [Mycobacterium sp.]|nr:Endoribonuclease [Mycobacterium sp.]
MSSPSQRLADLGLVLPAVTPPLAAYVPAVVHGGLVWSSGQLPMVEGKLLRAGLVGSEVEPADAAELARICALNALAAVASVAGPGGLDSIARIVKVVGFVASAPGFAGQPGVVDGASKLLAEVFGEAGRSARSAVGVAALPLGAPVEVELIAALAVESV